MSVEHADVMTTDERSPRPGVLLTAGRAVAFAMTFVTPLVLVRIFTPAEFGTYKQLLLMAGTIVAIAQLGMADSLLYFLPSAPGRGGRYLLHALLALAASGLVCLTLLALGGPLLARWLGNPALLGLAGLLGAYVLLLLPATVLEIVLTARKQFAGAGLAYGISDLLRAVALVIPTLITRRLEWLLLGAVAFGAVRLLVTLTYLVREFRGELTLDPAALRSQLGYGLPLQLGVALWILVQNLHYYIVAARVDAATFAIYAVGCLQIPIVDILSTPARNLLTVRMREAMTANRVAAARALWHDTTARLALVMFPLTGLLVATAPDLIPVLFTDRYAASIPILMIWSTIAVSIALQADGVLAAHADTRAIAVLRGVQVLLIAGLVPALMGPFGLIGAVTGTALAIGIGTGLVLLRAQRLMRVGPSGLLPWRRLGAVLVAAAAATLGALLVREAPAAGALSRLLLTAAAFTGIYLGILGAVAPREYSAPQAILKEIAAWGLVLSGLARIAAWLNRRKSLVLLYHGVHGGAMDPVLNYNDLHVSVQRFERQMRYIAAHYHVVPLDQLLERRRDTDGKPLAAITFDDGYGNLYDYAYPVLVRLGLPATVFMMTDFLNGRQMPWWDRMAAMVAASGRTEVSIPMGAAERRFSLGSVEQKRAALRTLFKDLLALPPGEREAALQRAAQALGVAAQELQTLRPLTTHQLLEMAGRGITVGAHGCSHDSFLHLDEDKLAAELTGSRSTLEALTGRPVRWLAYPHGAFTRDAVQSAVRAGYRGGVTAIEQGLNDGIPDPFAVRRIGTADDVSLARFIVAVTGIRDTWRGLVKRRTGMRDLRRRLAVRLCLGMVWLFRRAPLKRLALRTEGTTRYHSTEQYIAERVAEVPAFRALFAPFASFRGKVVAELGCSLGYMMDTFQRHEEFTAIGIDIDPTALALGRQMYGDRITFVQSAPAAIPLPSSSVDVLYSIDTVEHINPPREVLLECYRILRPGGVFLVHFWPWWGPMGAHLEDIIIFPWPHVLFSMDTLLRAAAELYDSPAYVPACYWFDPQTGRRRPNPYRDHQRWQEYINRLTVRGFRTLLRELPFEVVHFRKFGFEGTRIPGSRYLTRLTAVPWLDEYVTKAIFCVLRKPLTAAAGEPDAPSPGADRATATINESWWGIGAGVRTTAGPRKTPAGAR